jgi:hypothetical protein
MKSRKTLDELSPHIPPKTPKRNKSSSTNEMLHTDITDRNRNKSKIEAEEQLTDFNSTSYAVLLRDPSHKCYKSQWKLNELSHNK